MNANDIKTSKNTKKKSEKELKRDLKKERKTDIKTKQKAYFWLKFKAGLQYRAAALAGIITQLFFVC